MLLLATYPSSHAALAAEKLCKAAGIPVELIPVPRQIHSACGFCLLVEDAEGTGLPGTPESLWRVLEPAPGTVKKRYEPWP